MSIHLPIVAIFVLQQQLQIVATETTWPINLEIFTFWSFTEKVANSYYRALDVSLTAVGGPEGFCVGQCHDLIYMFNQSLWQLDGGKAGRWQAGKTGGRGFAS